MEEPDSTRSSRRSNSSIRAVKLTDPIGVASTSTAPSDARIRSASLTGSRLFVNRAADAADDDSSVSDSGCAAIVVEIDGGGGGGGGALVDEVEVGPAGIGLRDLSGTAGKANAAASNSDTTASNPLADVARDLAGHYIHVYG